MHPWEFSFISFYQLIQKSVWRLFTSIFFPERTFPNRFNSPLKSNWSPMVKACNLLCGFVWSFACWKRTKLLLSLLLSPVSVTKGKQKKNFPKQSKVIKYLLAGKHKCKQTCFSVCSPLICGSCEALLHTEIIFAVDLITAINFPTCFVADLGNERFYATHDH